MRPSGQRSQGWVTSMGAAVLGAVVVAGVVMTAAAGSGSAVRELGLALVSGAVVGGALLFVQVLLDRAADRRGERASMLAALSVTTELDGIDLAGRELRRVYLPGRALVAARLSGADLTGAQLLFGDLRYAELVGAVLVGADLSGSRLEGSDVQGADLSGASLEDTNLSHADLSRCRLTGAQLQGVRAIGTKFVGVDLAGASIAVGGVGLVRAERRARVRPGRGLGRGGVPGRRPAGHRRLRSLVQHHGRAAGRVVGAGAAPADPEVATGGDRRPVAGPPPKPPDRGLSPAQTSSEDSSKNLR